MDNLISFPFLYVFYFIKGDSCSDRREGRRWFPWCVWFAYPLGINDLSENGIKVNKK